MKKECVITIGREHGSGGRTIGKKLAQELGIPFYDRELVSLAARESGFSERFIGEIEQRRHTGSYLYDTFVSANSLPIGDQVYLAQSRVIASVAAHACVIVGRCADYVLRERENCLNVFVHAPIEARARRVTEEYHDAFAGDAQAYLRKQDKGRAAYYNYMTQRVWGQAVNYDLCVNSNLGINQTVGIISLAYEQMRGDGE